MALRHSQRLQQLAVWVDCFRDHLFDSLVIRIDESLMSVKGIGHGESLRHRVIPVPTQRRRHIPSVLPKIDVLLHALELA